MGSFRALHPVQSAQRRPSIAGVWQFPGWLWILPHCIVIGRNGIHVRSSIALVLGRTNLLTCGSDPVVGAQYRWSAQFAPMWSRFWGLFQGWMTVFAWVTVAAASPAYLAQGTQALILLNNPIYTPQPWHTTLLMCAFVVPAVAANLWFKKIINPMEMVGAIGHGLFWLVTIIVLGVTGSRSSHDFVWRTLTNDQSGWNQPGLVFGIGLLPVAFPITSFDGVLHMSKQP